METAKSTESPHDLCYPPMPDVDEIHRGFILILAMDDVDGWNRYVHAGKHVILTQRRGRVPSAKPIECEAVLAAMAGDRHWLPIHWAARLGATKIIRHAAKSGVAFDVTTDDGLTPLDIAHAYGQAPAMVTLLQLGADPKNGVLFNGKLYYKRGKKEPTVRYESLIPRASTLR